MTTTTPAPCYHPLSCRRCSYAGQACGHHRPTSVGDQGHTCSPCPPPVDPFIPITQCAHEDVEWCGEQLSCVECGASGEELEDPAPVVPGQFVFGPAALIAAYADNATR